MDVYICVFIYKLGYRYRYIHIAKNAAINNFVI